LEVREDVGGRGFGFGGALQVEAFERWGGEAELARTGYVYVGPICQDKPPSKLFRPSALRKVRPL
jgi:hypothetical protein